MYRVLAGLRNSIPRSLNFSTEASTAFSVAITRKHGPKPPESSKNYEYYPVSVGDVYNQRYRVVRQLGWGLYSTVWQVEELQ